MSAVRTCRLSARAGTGSVPNQHVVLERRLRSVAGRWVWDAVPVYLL